MRTVRVGVLRLAGTPEQPLMLAYRAKYIEGLENRLGRMESLLRLSGMDHHYFLVSRLSANAKPRQPADSSLPGPLEKMGRDSEESPPARFIPRIP